MREKEMSGSSVSSRVQQNKWSCAHRKQGATGYKGMQSKYSHNI